MLEARGDDHAYWFERGMDHLADALREEAYPAESGMPLADFECEHGFLPQDTAIICHCWGHNDMLEDLMARMNEKSENARLLFCPKSDCRVTMFKPDPAVHEICPSCGTGGVLLREPTATRAGVRP